jgi:hypothetical protein
MLYTPTADHHESLFALLVQRFHDWRERRTTLAGLDLCGRDEAVRMARDLSLTTGELRALTRNGPHAADLLYRRMAELGLDRDAIAYREACASRDMQKACALCDSKGRCRHDFARVAAPSAWQAYCRNDDTLQALAAAGTCPAPPAAVAAIGADDRRVPYASLLVLLIVALACLALFALASADLRSHPDLGVPAAAPAASAVTCLDASCLAPAQQTALRGLWATRAQGMLASSTSQRAAISANAGIVQTIAADEASICAQQGGAAYYGMMFQNGCSTGGAAAARLDGYDQCLPMAGGGVCLIK